MTLHKWKRAARPRRRPVLELSTGDIVVHRELTMPNVARFCDGFTDRSPADFVHANPCAGSAILKALSWLPRRARHVLEIACGIGWSSWEIKRHHPSTEVVGVDFSPRMIELANALFTANGLTFRFSAIGEDRRVADGQF